MTEQDAIIFLASLYIPVLFLLFDALVGGKIFNGIKEFLAAVGEKVNYVLSYPIQRRWEKRVTEEFLERFLKEEGENLAAEMMKISAAEFAPRQKEVADQSGYSAEELGESLEKQAVTWKENLMNKFMEVR